jgi:hypothetical protein
VDKQILRQPLAPVHRFPQPEGMAHITQKYFKRIFPGIPQRHRPVKKFYQQGLFLAAQRQACLDFGYNRRKIFFSVFKVRFRIYF